MTSVRSRLVTLLVAASLFASVAITGSSTAAADWSIRISAANSGNYTDSTGKVWLSDRYYQGGSTWRNVQPIGDTDDPKLYQGHRWGMNGYNIPVPEAGTYTVSLHFAELVFDQPGKRVFDVSAEGAPKVSGLDVVNEAGYAGAHIETFETDVNDGTLNLAFGRVVEDPMISAIEVSQVGSTPPPPPPAAFERRVNAGSGTSYQDKAGSTWSADASYVGGGTFSASSNASVGGTEDAPLYRTHRWGMRAYRVAVPAKGTYQVKLHFAEMVFRDPGKRVFNVLAEGRKVISELDVVAEAGYATALVKTLDVKVNDGVLNVRFPAIVEDPMVSGIEVVLAQPVEDGVTTTTAAPTTTTAAPTTTTSAPTTTTSAPTTTTTTAPQPPTGNRVIGPNGIDLTGYANETNTGPRPGSVLTPSGNIWTSSDGQVIENVDVNGTIFVDHNNVVVRNVRVRTSSGVEGIRFDPNKSGLLIEDCELDGRGSDRPRGAVAWARYTIRRCNIHGFGMGLAAYGDNIIEDNYIHDMEDFLTPCLAEGGSAGDPGGCPHQVAVQMEWGDNTKLRRNTILMPADGATATISAGYNAAKGTVVENNIIGGYGSFAVQAGCGYPAGYNTDRIWRNNRITTVYHPLGGWYGTFSPDASSCIPKPYGNVWHDGPNAGQPVPGY
jgi:hypothetical protein